MNLSVYFHFLKESLCFYIFLQSQERNKNM